jgi:N-methylhydantoinase A
VKVISDYWIERSRLSSGYPIMVPVVDLVEIGNGGGSIAWVDDFGKLHVGPQSAGAMPGPAAYGRGGTEATTTDANLELGRINRDFFCGGEVVADMEAAGKALDRVAAQLGVDRAAAARGVVRIANNNMVNALKLISLNRGYDPRDFTLVAFGGGGGMHAVALAAELGITKVVIPRAADVFSAWGMLMSDLRRDYFLTRLVDLTTENAARVEAVFGELEEAAVAQFAAEGVDTAQVTFRRHANLRYTNQEHGVEILLPGGTIDAAAVEAIQSLFHESYEREYTYRLDAPVEFVGGHLVAVAEVGKLEPARLPVTGTTLDDASKGIRLVDYATEGIHEADIYDGDLLEPGASFTGPAIVETKGTTTVVHPGNEAAVDEFGNLIVTLEAL